MVDNKITNIIIVNSNQDECIYDISLNKKIYDDFLNQCKNIKNYNKSNYKIYKYEGMLCENKKIVNYIEQQLNFIPKEQYSLLFTKVEKINIKYEYFPGLLNYDEEIDVNEISYKLYGNSIHFKILDNKKYCCEIIINNHDTLTEFLNFLNIELT